MKFTHYDNAVLLSDLPAACEEKEHLSPVFERGKWGYTEYETSRGTKGVLLSARADSRAKPITIDPGLKGWYAIFVGLPEHADYDQFFGMRYSVRLKLTTDKGGTQFCPQCGECAIGESYWKCADMTGEKIVISKYVGMPADASVAWFRFVPLTEEEVSRWHAEEARTDTKRLYMTHDMHTFIIMNDHNSVENAYDLVEDYLHSDCEWLSLENVMSYYDGDPLCGDIERQSYMGDWDIYAHRSLHHLHRMFPKAIEYGHSCGIKVCISHRMGPWGIEYPDNAGYFNNKFFLSHKQYRCVDRDGNVVDALSYAYPEVQDYIISKFTASAAYDPDAVEMIFNRGVPYVLFEPPVQELFVKKYPGVDMRLLPIEDERILDIHCEIMTGFIRKLRAALDAQGKEAGKTPVRLHARGLFSLYDSRLVGLDLKTWAAEGLISAIISYPQRIYERLPDEVWADPDHNAIDLENYTRYVRTGDTPAIVRISNFPFREPRPDYKGVLRGPTTQKERIHEFMDLEREYGVTFYADILPRLLTPEQYKERLLELYECGAGHFSFWDTIIRNSRKVDWSMVSRLGHKDELADFDSGKESLWHKERIIAAGGMTFTHYYPNWGG